MGRSVGKMIYPHQRHVQSLLKEYQLAPLKKLGQHFLIDQSMAKKIYEFLDLKKGDHVIEVGSGLGAMIFFFLQRKDIFLTSVEIDKGMIAYLKDLQKNMLAKERWNIIHCDILKYNWERLFIQSKRSKLLSNLPYGITGPFLMQLLQYRKRLSRCVLLLQDVVVEKILASTPSKHYNRLSVYFRLWAFVSKLVDVPRQCFYPRPRVDSKAVRIDFKTVLGDENFILITCFVSTLFNHKRKRIGKTLRNFSYHGRSLKEHEIELVLLKTGIDSWKRPQELCPEDFIRIFKNVQALFQ